MRSFVPLALAAAWRKKLFERTMDSKLSSMRLAEAA